MNDTDDTDREAVLGAVHDYWEGWFDGDAVRMERSLHPELDKTGVGADDTGRQVTETATAGEMIGWTRDGAGVAQKPADPRFEVTVTDLYDEIATVTVDSTIYREYLHLLKTPEGWRIRNSLYMRVDRD